jgi:uncharacterized OsmC-like protein
MNKTTMNDTAMLTQSTLNGIDTKRQSQTMDTIRKNLAAGAVRLRAVNRWQGGTQTQSRISAFDAAGGHHQHVEEFAVDTDLPEAFLGTDQGAAPTEHALQALAACMTTTMVYNCAARGIEVRSVESEVQGDMNAAGFFQVDETIRRGFSGVRIKFNIDANAPDEELQQLLQASPIFDVFTNGVPVSVELGEV